ncbi:MULTISPECIES: DUF1569 domain-containing protein [unclassified Colwellia]|uniref:DUF1569 domain-containing protein n=1 Tax=unclassified Colwellia TaxID=196834 RepID=UPI0015F395D7|nr:MULTISPECIES: DUF1569 domain-containing protein [unclassified Colwellia]MBA6357938.1 DUF1569 domain-containing protein [Colwellia sp. BRX8-3]MBA6361772.1 DUF1569 domain-containing protein [Colwellia sp. BRX8-6]MBA6369428.1 DUF1569 domain-containing protein [Colwellia sp. BRX8-5]MBA6376741.1 DUF1569 domain-containing protein [Colwellia sp. BRX8-2]MBA6379247.1 DUF1569 domain-containing protein [Colwellia sp. BRX10-7]
MKRRQFVKASLVGGGVILGVGAGAFTLIKEGNKNSLTVEMALKKLDDLSDESLIHQGEWNPYQIFSHCAQSVEFSMSEFPEHKSNLFKSTVGQLAFSIFASKGKMTHNLGEPIPSAPIIIKHLDSTHALIRLKQSLLNFSRYQGILAPHFAYGELSKAEYEIAHVMHLYNHLQEIKT